MVKPGKVLPAGARRGTVLTALGPHWLVAPEITDHGLDAVSLMVCSVSGTVDAQGGTTLVAVGDVVWFVSSGSAMEVGGQEYAEGTIEKVETRRTLLSRKAAGRVQREQVLAANIDRLGIVIAAANPDYHRGLIDRYLIAADKGDLEPFIIVNKMDLVSGELETLIAEDLEVYTKALRRKVFFVSTVSGFGIDLLTEFLNGATTLLAGQSGVGKSSLINHITQNHLRVGSISQATGKGRHTTTSALLVPLPRGGFVIDSPGTREFSIWELDLQEIMYYFEEFDDYSPNCKFSTCTHTHEPGCAVKDAVDKGAINAGRYFSYLALRAEIEG
ncbi:MAG: ribosome small subunit-dependent GTPase A [Chlorobi bacterium OLB6]|nr:MAG: ribosome small subunit-dependent GTPase A [Chlorobi bacterium OLB6]